MAEQTNTSNISKSAAFFQRYQSSPHGINSEEVQKRLTQYGENVLTIKKKKSLLLEFLAEFKDLMVIILILAGIFAFFSGETTDAVIIIFIVILNALIGFVQKYKAEKAIEALQKMVAPQARVLRDGKQEKIPASQVVPGDILILEEGDIVNADAVLFEENEIEVQEAILTGESSPVEKNSATFGNHMDSPNIGEKITEAQKNQMIFMGTTVTHGTGRAVVFSTGMKTEMGTIAALTTETKKDKSPLEKELQNIGVFVGKITLVITGLLFVIGAFIQHKNIIDTLIFATSVAVAAVPEGLPATITIALAIGVQKLAKQNAIIKQLSSVETLGATTVICSDKTGTLTKNEMTVKKIFFDRYSGSVEGVGYDPHGSIQIEHNGKNPIMISNNDHFEKMANEHPDMFDTFELLLLAAGFCNNADVVHANAASAQNQDTPNSADQDPTKPNLPNVDGQNTAHQTNSWKAMGDPTEAALITFVKKSGFNFDEAKKKFQKIHEYPFDSTRKRMTVIIKTVSDGPVENSENILEKSEETTINKSIKPTEKFYVLCKGAPGSVLGVSSHVMLNNHPVLVDNETRDDFLEKNETMAMDALRCLGFAYRELTPHEVRKHQLAQQEVEQNLVFLGLIGMVDPPRPEVIKAIELTQRAGIKVYIITGDHGLTAEAVAKQIGLIDEKSDHRIIYGEQLENMSLSELKKLLSQKDLDIIFARVSPSHKLKIVSALKELDEIVAVTGDGVNDAPALKRADIGVAMGITGTDVSKEAANMILSDDSFATIVTAIREGRVIYENLKKSIFYVFSCNIGELILIFGAIVLNLPMPLTAILILFVNLTTDVLPAIALGVEPGEKNIMEKNPRQPKQKILNRNFIIHIFIIGLVIGIGALIAYMWDLTRLHVTFEQAVTRGNFGYLQASTLTFILIVAMELANALNARSADTSLFKIKFFSNLKLIWAIVISMALALLIVEIPFFEKYFHTTALGILEWVLILAGALAIILVEEIYKIVKKRRNPQIKTLHSPHAHGTEE